MAGFLHSFVRHADVVKIANLAQNVIAPLIRPSRRLLRGWCHDHRVLVFR